MKKIILVVLLALSLSGDSFLCKESFKSLREHQALLQYSIDRKDANDIKNNMANVIRYSEFAIVDCGEDWELRSLTIKLREALVAYANEYH